MERNDHAAIYVQKDGNRIVSYEVGYIKSDKGGTFKGVTIEAGERFWSDNDFGVIAWTMTEKERAMDRYAEITEQSITKVSTH